MQAEGLLVYLSSQLIAYLTPAHLPKSYVTEIGYTVVNTPKTQWTCSVDLDGLDGSGWCDVTQLCG